MHHKMLVIVSTVYFNIGSCYQCYIKKNQIYKYEKK